MLVATPASSGNPGNGVFHHGHAISLVLVVDRLKLIVLEVFDVDIAVDERLPHVDKQQANSAREDYAHPVA